ncbi:hypothetical protein [Roseateles sp.]|uniref:hypothetical protein n=1 Tax=Roseateles sp. TaxID=1971397 RepID=UPI0025DECA60|nr:hypothetical protein [Roseateles sp.]MBV8037240.1 hypothetical protein [Roseateles sp.]
MSYFFWESKRWLSNPLCCRCLIVVPFGRLRVPMRREGEASAAQWHRALGLFTDGWLEVLGAWREEGAVTPLRIAAGLRDLGIKRIKSLQCVVSQPADGATQRGLASKHRKTGSRLLITGPPFPASALPNCAPALWRS